MADTQQTIALLSLGQEMRGDIVRQVNRMSAALRVLPIRPGAGQNCAWSVELDGQTAANFAEGADLADYASDTQKQAILPWARVGSGFVLSGSAIRAAKTAKAGPGGLRDLVGRNIKNATAAVASKVNAQLFTGTGASNQLAGLGVAIGNDANIYATIDRSTSALWRPSVIDPGSPYAPGLADFRKDRTAVYLKCGEQPDLAFVHPDTFDYVGSLFDSTRRYVTEVTTARGRVILDGGFAGIELDGMVFLKDKDVPVAEAHYVNSNHVEIQYQPLDPDVMEALESQGITLAADDGWGPIPLGIRVEKQAKVGDADKYMAFTEAQLVVRRPNSGGVRKNINNAIV